MIRHIFNILVIVLSLSLVNCRGAEEISVKKLIAQYELKSLGDYEGGKRLENKWFSKDSSILSTLYENRENNHFLYIAQNRFKDTIFKFFDSTVYNLKIRKVLKHKGNYFVAFWNPPLGEYQGHDPLPNSRNIVFEDLYSEDVLSLYHIDSTSNQLTQIPKPPLPSLANTFQNSLKVEGNFSPIKSGSKIRLVKDTLQNNKMVYSADVGLEIKENKTGYGLQPYFFNTSKLQLNKNSVEIYQEPFLNSSDLNGIVKYYYAYDTLFNNNGYSRLDFVFRHNNDEHTISTSLDELFNEENFGNKYLDNTTSLIIEPFQYVNGEYFLRISQDSDITDYPSYPKIYHLDTVNWEIKSVLPLEKAKDGRYAKLNKTKDVEILSLVNSSDLRFVLENFEIVMVGQEYKLLKN
jgi:sRNA-binding regulator protein Hfq